MDMFALSRALDTEQAAAQTLSLVQTLLERVDTPATALPSLLSAINAAVCQFPVVFASRFADIVDLLVGWSLAPDLPPALLPALLECFPMLQCDKHPSFIFGKAYN